MPEKVREVFPDGFAGFALTVKRCVLYKADKAKNWETGERTCRERELGREVEKSF